MLDISQMFRTIANNRNENISELAKELGYTQTSFYTKVGSRVGALKLSVLESILHKLGYRLVMQVVDTEGKILYVTHSDPEHPLLDDETIWGRKEFYTQHVKGTASEGMKEYQERRRAEYAKKKATQEGDEQ